MDDSKKVDVEKGKYYAEYVRDIKPGKNQNKFKGKKNLGKGKALV